MRELIRFLPLFFSEGRMLLLGLLLALLTLLMAMGLLTLSGWFLAATALAGLNVATAAVFNYMLPSGGVRMLSILRTAGRWAERVVSHDATFRVLTQLRVWFWQRLSHFPAATLQSLRQGDLLNRMVADIEALDHLYLRLVTPICVSLFAIMTITVTLQWIDPDYALKLGTALLAFALAIPPLFYLLGRQTGIDLTQQQGRLRTAILDLVSAHTELTLFGAAERYQQKVANESAQLIALQQKMAQLSALSIALLQLFSGWTLTLLLWIAANGIQGAVPDARLALLIFATLASFEALNPLATAFQHLSATALAATRLNEVLHKAEPIAFGTLVPTIQGAIRLENIHFAYPNQAPLFNGCSFSLQPGEKVALIGETGCGKSTLLHLLTRDWTAEQGRIWLDDQPLELFSEAALRQAITVVNQRVYLFADTLRNNLRLAAPTANDPQLVSALQQVGLAQLLEANGLDQMIGDGGRALSGGERRRIGIARALLHDAPIWLLDEPTEGLDRKTEIEIMELLLSICTGKTMLMIAHRNYGLDRMDRTLRLVNGTLH